MAHALASVAQPASFEQVLRDHTSLLRWAVQGYFLRGAAHEDLMQEARLALWQAWRGYDPEKGMSFRSFATLVVRRKVVEAVRASTRDKRRPLRSYEQLEMLEGTEREPAVSDSAESAAARLVADGIYRRLTPLEAGSTALVHEYGYSFKDAARQLGVTTKAVDNAIVRARRKAHE